MCCWVFQCSLCLIHGWEQIPTGQKWMLAQLESYTRYLLWFVFWLKVYFFCFWGCWGEPGGNAADPGNLTIRKEGAEPTGDLEDVGVFTEDAEMLRDLGNTADAVAVSFGLVYLLDWSLPIKLKYTSEVLQRTVTETVSRRKLRWWKTNWMDPHTELLMRFETMSGCFNRLSTCSREVFLLCRSGQRKEIKRRVEQVRKWIDWSISCGTALCNPLKYCLKVSLGLCRSNKSRRFLLIACFDHI